MAKRRRRMVPENVRRNERDGMRCSARHPNWNGVRCERLSPVNAMEPHIVHTAEGRTFEWLDVRTGY